MNRVVVVLESTKGRRSFPPRASEPEIVAELARWLAGAHASVTDNGVCKSFTVGVHVVGADCDHEVGPWPVK